MENLSSQIFDLTSEPYIAAHRESVDSFDDNTKDLRYGIDYDYIVESFNCEYKLDVKRLQAIQAEYKFTPDPDARQALEYEFYDLYPEARGQDILSITNMPETILKKAYFVQSPKGRDGLPAVHYSLKEKILSDLRALRKSVKKLMFNAAQDGDSVSETRYDAKQKAIKVVCNSEYGASNNEYFAHYDPDIASAVTRGARRLIAFLSENLEHDTLYVDRKFLDDNKSDIANLAEIKALTVEPYKNPNETFLLQNFRHCIRRLFNDAYNLIQHEIYIIHVKPSTVCYQDTDSNYYKNKYITDYYTKTDDGKFICDPITVDNCMHSMLAHDNMICNFIKDAINRKPYELGFEGAFVVCRYLNRKKKYYGIKWGDDAELRLTAILPDHRAYIDEDPTKDLIDDYSPYWVPKKTVIPQPNGDYIFLDVDSLLHKGVNYLDYVHDQDVKCTGVDLARRDQYKFINFFHIVVLQKDLRLMKYNGSGEWDTFPINEPMKTIIDNVISTFRDIIRVYNEIANFATSTAPKYAFNILDFAKNGAYRVGKQNTVSQIVRRLEAVGKPQYIPGIGERMTYVTILDEATRANRNMGLAKQTNTSDRSVVVQELLDKLEATYPETWFNEQLSQHPDAEGLTYTDYINAKAICELDIKWYLEYLCKSMALYIVADVYPNEIKQIDDGLITPKEAGAIISKLQDNIAKTYVDMYFPRSKTVKNSLKAVTSNVGGSVQNRTMRTSSEASERIVRECFKNHNPVITAEEIQSYISSVESDITLTTKRRKQAFSVYTFISVNNFNSFQSRNDFKNAIYERYKENAEGLCKLIRSLDSKLNAYNKLLTALMSFKHTTSDED